MTTDRENAAAEFWRAIKLIVVLAIAFTIGAIVYLGSTGELYFHMVVAVIGGVFLSILLGCGLFAAAFFMVTTQLSRRSLGQDAHSARPVSPGRQSLQGRWPLGQAGALVQHERALILKVGTRQVDSPPSRKA